MQVQSLCPEDPLKEGMATHSSILAWRIPWTEEPGGYSPWNHKESDTTEAIEHEHKRKYSLTLRSRNVFSPVTKVS